MPKGVEHKIMIAEVYDAFKVNESEMPKGVEHFTVVANHEVIDA